MYHARRGREEKREATVGRYPPFVAQISALHSLSFGLVPAAHWRPAFAAAQFPFATWHGLERSEAGAELGRRRTRVFYRHSLHLRFDSLTPIRLLLIQLLARCRWRWRGKPLYGCFFPMCAKDEGGTVQSLAFGTMAVGAQRQVGQVGHVHGVCHGSAEAVTQ